MRVVTRKGASRVARAAFEIARTRPRTKVAAVPKAPTYKRVCGMFAEASVTGDMGGTASPRLMGDAMVAAL